MLWFLVALQATTPFIHAHAGAVQLNHANFLHVHQGVHSDAAYHTLAADEHGAQVDVAQGMPLRIDPLDAANDVPSAVALSLPRADQAGMPGAGLPALPQPKRAPPAHTHPHALAPPAV
ncbi:MAG: hypothetical protein Q7T90_12865 [Thiobacillus sp.]|nr:hypothetical protein [Thiobacillus sp.]